MHGRNGGGRGEGAHREQKVRTWPAAEGQGRRGWKQLREVARPLPSAVAVARAACPHQPPGRWVQLRPSAALGSLAEGLQRWAASMLNLAK
jgi:hypothetical protein